MYMFFHRKKNPPWLFIVAAVILTVGVVYFLEQDNAKERDTRRMADLKQMQTMLNYHYGLYGSYPQVTEFTCFKDAEGLFEALVPWLVTLPEDPKKGASVEPDDACYNYRSDDGTAYKIRAVLEKNTFSMEQDGGVSGEWYELFSTAAREW